MVSSLEPRKLITVCAKLSYGAHKWTFKSLDQYQIKGLYNGLVDEPNQIIESNKIELDIRPLANKEGKAKVDLIMGYGQGRFLSLEGDPSYE